MKKIKFYFSSRLTFDNNVHEHSFALRCIPPETQCQHIEKCSLELVPNVNVMTSKDSFGNVVTSGYIKDSHRYLDFTVTGIVKVDSSVSRTDFMHCYVGHSAMTKPSEEMVEYYDSIKGYAGENVVERAEFFSEKVYELMTYERDSTTAETVSADAFTQRKGVCQDYTQILLSILRLDKIPCRYVAGLAFCDGETHAWAEFWDGNKWIGIDPTNNCKINDDYIVLSQGRDSRDCAVNRGVMFGNYTRQITLVESRLENIYW